MKYNQTLALCAALLLAGPGAAVWAQDSAAVATAANRLESLDVVDQGGVTYVRARFKEALREAPASFSVAEPARIAFDFPNTVNALGRTQQIVGQGAVNSTNIVQSGDRTRVVLNLTKMAPYDTRLEGNDLVIALTPVVRDSVETTTVGAALASFTATKPDPGIVPRSVQDISFRRGENGEGRVVVQLSNADTGVDIRSQGGNLVVDFLNTALPEHLRRRSDVTDFATPVTAMTADSAGQNTRLVITPNGMWEHNAYQSDTQFVLEVKRVVEDPNKLVQGQGLRPGQFGGEKLSLNFQNIDVRAVLQVIADFTNFNIVTSDSVQGSLTLRLKDVPWDQALDIILQAKNLDMRKNGNVIWIAPAEELAAREKMQMEAVAQRNELEPVQTESFQINYHRAEDIVKFLRDSTGSQSALSTRGSITADTRSNKVFVTDVSGKLDAVRRLIAEIDTAPRQVLIEARIVEANKNFARDLGVRLGVGGVSGRTVGYTSDGRPIRQGTFGGDLASTAANAGLVSGGGGGLPLNVNLPADGGNVLSMALWNSAATRFLNLELSAMESDNRGRVISSPRVLTANQVEAVIEQGTEIPYQEETSSGATNVEFKKAVMSLRVKPQITPDGRIQLQVQVNKDQPVFDERFSVPAIDTKNVTTEALVDNGGTVVIGGIFTEEETNNEARVPLLGEIPVLGNLFRSRAKTSRQQELLVFITPRIVSDDLTLR